MHLVVMALMRSCISCHFREIPMFAEHKFDIFGDNLRMPMLPRGTHTIRSVGEGRYIILLVHAVAR